MALAVCAPADEDCNCTDLDVDNMSGHMLSSKFVAFVRELVLAGSGFLHSSDAGFTPGWEDAATTQNLQSCCRCRSGQLHVPAEDVEGDGRCRCVHDSWNFLRFFAGLGTCARLVDNNTAEGRPRTADVAKRPRARTDVLAGPPFLFVAAYTWCRACRGFHQSVASHISRLPVSLGCNEGGVKEHRCTFERAWCWWFAGEGVHHTVVAPLMGWRRQRC
mmetsp:Transcript_52011/g.121305  ORF Transcript_52011/g.121305 Transcript_52011/m.121305 type:complete len:218 (+) Transcript_52011:388-1041(+)